MNQIIEPEICTICSDRYTAVIRRKTTCKYCGASTCSKCVEQYLLTRHEDAHCLHCRVNYNDASLHSICTKTYLKQTYFKHRQEVLINRERSSLPALQDEALRFKKLKVLNEEMIHKTAHAKDARIAYRNALTLQQYHLTKFRAASWTKERGYQFTDEQQDIMDADRQEVVRTYKIRNDTYDEYNKLHREIWRTRRAADEDDDEEATIAAEKEKKQEEKRKFVRRCTNNGCQGFLSTAWKCGMCEFYSCPACFMVRGKEHDAPHECKKEDVETAELIKKDSKPCPKCGEFITKASGCDQMYCISCQTPFSWETGKIVTTGPIHNPHYYEWLRRTGGGVAPRNPADIICGGYPDAWQLVRTPPMRKNFTYQFIEFHRICLDLQAMSQASYRSHLDQQALQQLNILFLAGECTEKKWGQKLATLEKKRKRDAEVQEVMGAFRMVSVELINRIQNYSDENRRGFTDLPYQKQEELMNALDVEIDALIVMINDAMRAISVASSYAVPHITKRSTQVYRHPSGLIDVVLYQTGRFNFGATKKRAKKAKDESDSDEEKEEVEEEVEQKEEVEEDEAFNESEPLEPLEEDPDTMDELEQIQLAIQNSLKDMKISS